MSILLRGNLSEDTNWPENVQVFLSVDWPENVLVFLSAGWPENVQIFLSAGWPENVQVFLSGGWPENVQVFLSAGFILEVIAILIQTKLYFFASNLNSSLLVHSLPVKSGKQLARDVFGNFVTFQPCSQHH